MPLSLFVLIGFGAFGKADPGMEVGFTFKEIFVALPEISIKDEELDISKKDVAGIVKLKLESWGLRANTMSLNGSYLQAVVTVVEGAYAVEARFRKIPTIYGIPDDRYLGNTCEPAHQAYKSIGAHAGNKELVLEALGRVLNTLLLDYVDSNKKYKATRKDKKLRGVDKAIYGSIKMEFHKGVEWNYHMPVQPIHAGWWLKYQDLTGQAAHTHPSVQLVR